MNIILQAIQSITPEFVIAVFIANMINTVIIFLFLSILTFVLKKINNMLT